MKCKNRPGQGLGQGRSPAGKKIWGMGETTSHEQILLQFRENHDCAISLASHFQLIRVLAAGAARAGGQRRAAADVRRAQPAGSVEHDGAINEKKSPWHRPANARPRVHRIA